MNIKDLDLNLLVVFEAIYTTKNISRAGEMLDLSQPTISNALRRLREKLDDRLFVRSDRGVIPTARANEIIKPVREALALISQTLDPAAQFFPSVSKRAFKILIADVLEPLVLPPLINALAHGDSSLQLVPPQSTKVEEALIEDRIDLAVFIPPYRQPEICFKALTPFDVVIVARQGHPRIDGQIVPPQILQENHINLSLNKGILENTEKLSLASQFKVRSIANVNNSPSVAHLVSLTDAIGFLPRLYANHVAPLYGLQILESPIDIIHQNFCLIWHERQEQDSSNIWLRHQIENIISGLVGGQQKQVSFELDR